MLRFVVVVLAIGSVAWGQGEVHNDATYVVIRGPEFTIRLGKEAKGGITSLVDNSSGQEFAVKDAPAPLFQIAVSPRGKSVEKLVWLSSRDAETVEYVVEKNRASLTFKAIGGRRVTAVCVVKLSADGKLALWSFRVESEEALILEDVEYPVIALRAPLGGNGESDAFVYGLSMGGVFQQPHRWPLGKWVAARQPSVLAAQFGCYYDARAGVYTATRDTKGYPKSLGMRRTKTGVELFWRHHGFHDLSKPFKLAYPIGQGTFRSPKAERPTDWRDAADIYKAWALKQPWCKRTLARRDDLPNWLRQGPMMVRFGRHWLGRPERIEGWLKDYYAKYFPNVPLIVAFWGWEGIGSWVSPKYFPPYPSENGFRKYVDAVHAAGGHTFFWPSGYQWALTYQKRDDDTFEYDGREWYAREGKSHTIITRNGSPYIRKYRWLRGGENATLCRGDAWTRNWLNNIAVELAKRGGDMIQVDQVVSGGMPGGGNCFSAQHGHPPGPGLWDAEAFHEQLRTMRDVCKAVNRDIIVGFEQPQELFNQEIGIQDYRDWQVVWKPMAPGHTPASVFSYLYHEFVPCFQSNPRRNDKRMMAYCLVNGQVPHIVPHWPVYPAPLLKNGGFEVWEENVPEGWQHVKGWKDKKFEGVPYCDEKVKHGGRFSLRLECRKEDGITQVSQNVPIGDGALEVGKRYRLSLWFKAENLPKPNAIPFAALTRQLKSKGGGKITVMQCDEWRRGEAEFTVPEGADFLRIMLNIVGPCKIWIDDIALEEQTGDGEWRPVMTKGVPADHDLAVQWVELFHGKGRSYLLLGRMLHPPKLDCGEVNISKERTLPAILHNAYCAPDGSEAVVLVNITDVAQRGKLAWAGQTIDLSLKPWEVRLIEK
ncbi:MAG: hypothetical protein GXP25_23900 [Planctomycetes bacterium]|nr:hypothetical protein [Planctomycetota bacterium]